MSSRAVARNPPAPACPCGSGAAYRDCCGPLHAGAPAATAEALMRARYSAYVAGDDAFIAASWHATTRVPMTSLNHEPGAQAPTQWLGLDIRRHEAAGDTATVEFVARFKTGGRAERLHEISRFVREGGAWWYVDGSFPDAQAGSTTGSKTATMTKARTQKQ